MYLRFAVMPTLCYVKEHLHRELKYGNTFILLYFNPLGFDHSQMQAVLLAGFHSTFSSQEACGITPLDPICSICSLKSYSQFSIQNMQTYK